MYGNLESVVDVQLSVEILDMQLDGALGDHQRPGDLLVGATFGGASSLRRAWSM
jgi:hypothetical protein